MTDTTASPRLQLRDFAPRSMLRVPSHQVEQPRFPVIDIHNHLGSVFAGDWAARSAAELVDVLDASGVERLVNLDGGQGEALAREIAKWQTATDGRVLVFSSLEYDRWAADPAFGETEAAALRDAATRGAHGLKVWKPLGLGARDVEGRLVAVDDPRLDPLWQAAAELRLPVLIHVGDPFAFFEPLDETNERWEELAAHPDWHFYPTRPADQPDAPGFPPVAEVLAAFARMVARHPATTFVAAHVASSAEDLGWVGRLLDARPNLSVDIAERIAELGRQPYSSREFFEQYADRIVFGVDQPADPATYRLHYRFLETLDESFDYGLGRVPRQGRWQIHGLGLPDDILRRVYRDNARRILGL